MNRLPVADEIAVCTACPLHASRNGIAVPSMPGPGYREGGIAIMTDMVKDSADYTEGVPFAGNRAEVRMLERLLTDAGLNRADVLMMFRVRCAPPRGRIGDYPEAVFNCDPWTLREFEAYKPGVVVLMGTSVLEVVYGAEAKITKVRGQPRATTERFAWGARVWVPTWHPYSASTSTRQQQNVIDDLRLARVLYEETQQGGHRGTD